MEREIICAGIIIDDIWRLLLVKRKYNLKSLPNHWWIPWGHLVKWEDLEQAVIREVKEETNLDFEITKIFDISEIKNNWSTTIKVINRFYGNATGAVNIQEEECDGYGWFTYNETKNLLIFDNLRKIIYKLKEENIIQ